MDASGVPGEPSLPTTLAETLGPWTEVRRKKPSPFELVEEGIPNQSFYSCSNLEEGEPGRYVKASDVRAQVAQIPEYKGPPRGTYKGGKNKEYPKGFGNIENFNLESHGPRIEYPLTPTGGQGWRDVDGTGKTAGLHRAICDRDKAYRHGFDVAYHDVTKSLNPARNLTLAKYRSAEEAAEKKRQQHERRTKRR